MLVYEHSQVMIVLGAFCERTLRTLLPLMILLHGFFIAAAAHRFPSQTALNILISICH